MHGTYYLDYDDGAEPRSPSLRLTREVDDFAWIGLNIRCRSISPPFRCFRSGFSFRPNGGAVNRTTATSDPPTKRHHKDGRFAAKLPLNFSPRLSGVLVGTTGNAKMPAKSLKRPIRQISFEIYGAVLFVVVTTRQVW